MRIIDHYRPTYNWGAPPCTPGNQPWPLDCRTAISHRPIVTRPTPGPWWVCPDVWKTCAATCGEVWSRLTGWKALGKLTVFAQNKWRIRKRSSDVDAHFHSSPRIFGASWWFDMRLSSLLHLPLCGVHRSWPNPNNLRLLDLIGVDLNHFGCPDWVVDPTGPGRRDAVKH